MLLIWYVAIRPTFSTNSLSLSFSFSLSLFLSLSLSLSLSPSLSLSHQWNISTLTDIPTYMLQLDIKDIHRLVEGTVDGNQAISDFSPYPKLVQEGDNTEAVSMHIHINTT